MFKQRYTYNKSTLSYESVDTLEYKLPAAIFGGLILVILGFIAGVALERGTIKNEIVETPTITTRPDMVLGSTEWKDSVFLEYQLRADLYLSRPAFNGSPVTGELLALAAYNAYDSTGILLPVELCLAQCQWESGMGLRGKSPTNNPFNIGEYDRGTVLWYDSTFEGTQAYFYFMTNNYLSCSTIDELFKNFVNCAGYRYASSDYESHIPEQYYFIKRWIDNRIK